ncbi:dihydrodipicolinate synthase family protein [Streptomyces sp. NPDC102473]|uniref:dihydrodipicolinate synthase family protein n=1 Tax=Streptomyces sp. NPDC102473 TaxID=3366180 RepID=UPI003804DA41
MATYSADTLARLADSCPDLIGHKDGIGDFDAMTRIHTRLGERLTYVGGLPTAEMFALPYLELGVTTYPSVIFNLLPDFTLEFYGAVRGRRHDTVIKMLDHRADTRSASSRPARPPPATAPDRSAPPPLTHLTEGELAELAALIAGVPAATA